MGKIDLNYPFMDKDERMEIAIYESTKKDFARDPVRYKEEKKDTIKLLALAIALLAIVVLVCKLIK